MVLGEQAAWTEPDKQLACLANKGVSDTYLGTGRAQPKAVARASRVRQPLPAKASSPSPPPAGGAAGGGGGADRAAGGGARP